MSALITLKNEGASADLINSLAELDIDSLISVDVKSTQLMMHEEMALIRAAIEEDTRTGTGTSTGSPAQHTAEIANTAVPPLVISDTTTGSGKEENASKETIEKLETENVNLRGLLKELKEELLMSDKNQSNGDSSSDVKISSLTEQLSGLQVTSDTHETNFKGVVAELAASKEALAELEGKFQAVQAKQTSLQQGSAGRQ
jgi:hypothetical protein